MDKKTQTSLNAVCPREEFANGRKDELVGVVGTTNIPSPPPLKMTNKFSSTTILTFAVLLLGILYAAFVLCKGNTLCLWQDSQKSVEKSWLSNFYSTIRKTLDKTVFNSKSSTPVPEHQTWW